MTTRIEDELRDLFETSGERFDMDTTLPPRVRRRARARTVRTLSAVVTVAVVAGSASLAMLGRSPSSGPRPADVHAPVVKLVDYVDDSTGADGSGLQQYAQCMRDQGFDVPDPTRMNDGWHILVPADSVDRSSPAWQEAAFVTCSLSKFVERPLTGDLILGQRTPDQIAGFLACMQAQGFDLPEPTQRADGQYVYDLQTTPIDTSSDSWNRAVFVTCAFPGD